MMMNKKGFTLMELVVYMAMIGIVVVIAGQAFSDSTKFRVRTQNMLKASEEAENVATVFKGDLAQMGAKSSKDATVSGSDDTFNEENIDDVYMAPNAGDSEKKDSSSFAITSTGNDFDELSFKKMRYSATGKYEGIDSVRWFMDGNTLKRQCITIKGGTTVDCAPTKSSKISDYTVDMATNVVKFRVLPAIPKIRSNALTTENKTIQLFPKESSSTFRFVSRYGTGNYNFVTVGDGGSSVSISGFASNFNEETNQVNATGKEVNQVFAVQNTEEAGNWSTLCASANNHFTLYPDMEYEIYFKMPYAGSKDQSQMFVPGVDHMAVGFRYADGVQPASWKDFLFYPPANNAAGTVPRTMRFDVKDTLKNVCLTFTFALYSPVSSKGVVTIEELKLNKVPSANYEFDKNAALAVVDKKNVKAFYLQLELKRGGNVGDKIGEVGQANLVIHVPSNGPRD